MNVLTADRIADVAVLIVGFRNPADIVGCLTAGSREQPATPWLRRFHL